MRVLSEKEKRQIQRYCAYPKIALRALIMSFAICALIVPLEMIDDLVFHSDGFNPAGLNAGIALVAISVAVFCFCALRPKFGMRGKQWLDLQNRLAVRQTQSDRSAQVAGVLATQAAGRPCKKATIRRLQAGFSGRGPGRGSGWRSKHGGRHAFGKREQRRSDGRCTRLRSFRTSKSN